MLDFDNFVLQPAEISLIFQFILDRARPVLIKELGELIIRRRLELHTEANQKRIYSPEQKYSPGEQIFFCFHDNKCRSAEILRIEPCSYSKYGSYERIVVSVEGFEKEKIYVSNCPNFPRRFDFRADDIDTANPGNVLATPGQFFTRYEDKIKSNMTQSLIKQDGFVNVNEEWFITDELPKIRQDEVQRCYDYIKKNGTRIASHKLVCEVLKCRPSSPKFNVFRFSLDHHLGSDRDFIKYQTIDGIEWDIKRSIPPRQIRNTLTLAALTSGFIKITKGLQELVDFCGADNEITFKSYGGYEVRGYIAPALKRICSDQIRQWFAENHLVPGDLIYIKSPIHTDEQPILYTAFERDYHEKTGEKEEKATLRLKTDFRHRIYGLLDSRGQYLHVKEIHGQIREFTSVDVTQPTIDAILSGNRHLFARLHASRGLWGLSKWATEQPSVDSVSLSIAIREEDWVIRLLEEELKPLAVVDLADRLSGIFITPKDKILEINFLDPNDERLVQMDGKWGLKVWARDWKARIKQINKELSEYRNLSAMLSEAEEKKLRLEKDISNLRNRKTLIQNQLTRLEKPINFTNQKISNLRREYYNLKAKTQFIQKEITANKSTGSRLSIITVFILASASLLLTLGDTYQSISLILGLLAAILFLLFLIRGIKIRFYKKKLWEKQKNLQSVIPKISRSLWELEQKHRKIISHCDRYLRSLELTEERIRTISNETNFTQNRIADISYQMKVSNEQELAVEKKELTDLINRCAL